MVKTQGKQVNEQEHLQLVEKMKQFDDMKIKTYLKNPTVEQALKELENCDEVVIKLQDDSILRVKKNEVWINGILAYAIYPTDTETGKTYEQGIHKSNNYTGEQLFKMILSKYLN